MSAGNPRTLIVATFLAFTVGAVAGYFLRPQLEGDEAPSMAARSEAAPHPVGAQEYVQLGMSALSAGQFEEAERRFRQALDQQPDSPGVQADLAVALMYQERWDEAWDAIQEAEELAPDMPEVHFLEGVVLRDARGDTAAARASFERYLELVPGDSPQATTVRQWLAEMDGTAPAGAPTGETPAAGGEGS